MERDYSFHMKHTDIGSYGETIVLNHLKHKGFKLIERNYRKKWGEIDLILKKQKKIHFVEVKTVSCEMSTDFVSRETQKSTFSRGNQANLLSHETWRPEDNVHRKKLQRFLRAVQTWIAEQNYVGDWQIDVVSVKLDVEERSGTIKIIDDVILE